MTPYNPEDDKADVPDGTFAEPHPMGPHGDPNKRYEDPEHDIVLEEGEVIGD